MIDFIKLVFGSIHDLPPLLRHGFVVLFFTTALLFLVSFKRWLEARKATKDADLWAHAPVMPSVAQVLVWVLWATASLIAVNDKSPTTAAAATAANGGPASAAASLRSSALASRPSHHASPAVTSAALDAKLPNSPTHQPHTPTSKSAQPASTHAAVHPANKPAKPAADASASIGGPDSAAAMVPVAPEDPRASAAAANLSLMVAESSVTMAQTPSPSPTHHRKHPAASASAFPAQAH